MGTLFLISGPSGSGKTSLACALKDRVPGLYSIVTTTTRKPRAGELNGRDYHFISEEDFHARNHRGEFVGTTYTYKEYYGIPKSSLDPNASQVIVITVDGARSLRRLYSNVYSIFIQPFDLKAAALHVQSRNAPNEALRLAAYWSELLASSEYDAIVLNDGSFRQALDRLEAVVRERMAA